MIITCLGTSSSSFFNGTFSFQWGFQVIGPIADEANEPAGRAVTGITTIDPLLLSTESFELNALSVNPNPTNDNWKISATSQIENVQVFDILGKQVMSLSPSSLEVDIPAERLKSGLYLARITGADGSDKTIRLLKN